MRLTGLGFSTGCVVGDEVQVDGHRVTDNGTAKFRWGVLLAMNYESTRFLCNELGGTGGCIAGRLIPTSSTLATQVAPSIRISALLHTARRVERFGLVPGSSVSSDIVMLSPQYPVTPSPSGFTDAVARIDGLPDGFLGAVFGGMVLLWPPNCHKAVMVGQGHG